MRKVLIVFLCLFFTTLFVNAQTPSFMSEFSSGLYRSERDAAFQVNEAQAGPLFSTLNNFYLFTGLTNWFQLNTESSSTGNPVAIGLYLPGTMPMSLYARFFNTVASSGTLYNGTSATTTQTVAVASGTTTTNHTWVSNMTDDQYSALETNNLDFRTLAIFKLGTMNLGAYIQAAYQNNVTGLVVNTWAANNRVRTQTVNYNTAGAGVVPVPAQDYTVTTTGKAPDSRLTIGLAVPFYIPLGSIKLTNTTNLSYEIRDSSTSTTIAYTAAQNAVAFAAVAAETSTTNVLNTLLLNSNTILSFAPVWGGHADNRLDIAVDAGANLYMPATSATRTLDYDINFTGAGAAQAITAYNTDSTDTYTYGSNFGWRLIPSVQHYFYFEPVQDIFFAFAPTMGLGARFTTPTTGYNTQRVQVVRTDVDANGQYTAADTIVTTTTDYMNYDDDNCFMEIIARCALPSSFRVTMKGMPFEIVMGNNVGMEYRMNLYNQQRNSTRTTVATADGTGAVTATAITTEFATTINDKSTSAWVFSNTFTFGLNFFLPADITLAVDINGANFLNFESLQAELIIPVKIPAAK